MPTHRLELVDLFCKCASIRVSVVSGEEVKGFDHGGQEDHRGNPRLINVLLVDALHQKQTASQLCLTRLSMDQ
jgi:hypothetical protein